MIDEYTQQFLGELSRNQDIICKNWLHPIGASCGEAIESIKKEAIEIGQVCNRIADNCRAINTFCANIMEEEEPDTLNHVLKRR